MYVYMYVVQQIPHNSIPSHDRMVNGLGNSSVLEYCTLGHGVMGLCEIDHVDDDNNFKSH